MQNSIPDSPRWRRLARRGGGILSLLVVALTALAVGLVRADAPMSAVGAVMWLIAYAYSTAYLVAWARLDDHRPAAAILAWGGLPLLGVMALGDRLETGVATAAAVAGVLIGALAIGLVRLGPPLDRSWARAFLVRSGGAAFLLWALAELYILFGRAVANADLLFASAIFLLPTAPFALWGGLRLMLTPDPGPQRPPT